MPTKAHKKPGRPAKIEKDALLDVAEKLFSEKGFVATTTRDLASHARCNVALISYHFGSKDGLYRAVILRHFERSRDRYLKAQQNAVSESDESLRKAWPELKDPFERRFCAALYGLGGGMIENTQMQRILCRELMNGGRNVVDALIKLDQGASGLLRKSLESMIKGKRLREGLDLRLAVVTLIGPFVYTCVSGPILKELYGFRTLDDTYVRQLSVHLTRTIFEGWRR